VKIHPVYTALIWETTFCENHGFLDYYSEKCSLIFFYLNF
jgi:hypothetical protein